MGTKLSKYVGRVVYFCINKLKIGFDAIKNKIKQSKQTNKNRTVIFFCFQDDYDWTLAASM